MNFFRIISLFILTCATTLVYSQGTIRYVNCEKKDVDDFVSILTNFEDIKIQEYLPRYIKELTVNLGLIRVIHKDSLGIESYMFQNENPSEIVFCIAKIKNEFDPTKLTIRFIMLEEVHIVAQEYVIENNELKEFLQYHIPTKYKNVSIYTSYYSFEGLQIKIDFSPYIYEPIPAIFMADLESYEREGEFKKVVSSKGKVSLYKGINLIKELTPIKANLFQLNYFDKKGKINQHKLIEIDSTGKAVLRFDSEKQYIKINDQNIQVTFDLEERISDSVFTSKRNGSKIILQKRYNPSGLFEENQTVSRNGKTISFDGILYNFPEKNYNTIEVNDSIYLIKNEYKDKGSILQNIKTTKQESPIEFMDIFKVKRLSTVYIVSSGYYGIVDEKGNYLVELQRNRIAALNDTTLLIQNRFKNKFDTLPLNGRKYGGMFISSKLDLSDCIIREKDEIKYLIFSVNKNTYEDYRHKVGVFDVKNQNWLIKPSFDYVRMFNSFFIMTYNNWSKLCDPNKRIILDSINNVFLLNDTLLIYSKKNKFGIMNRDKQFIQPVYDRIYPYFDSIIVSKDENFYFLNNKNVRFIPDSDIPRGEDNIYGVRVFTFEDKLGYIAENYSSSATFDLLILLDIDEYPIKFQQIFYKQEYQYGIINEKHQRIDLEEMFEKFVE